MWKANPIHIPNMSNLNKVMLIGRLTRNPELRHTPRGTALAQFGFAVNRSFTNESGEIREETTFMDISASGKQAELASKYLQKGHLAYIEGRLRMESWTNKATGQNRVKLGVISESIQFLEPGPGSKGSFAASHSMALLSKPNDDCDEPF